MSKDILNDVFFCKLEKSQEGEYILPLPDEIIKRFDLSEDSELIIIIKDQKIIITKA